MIAFPNAKVNLGLFVTGKRPDGYHNLESCFLPVKVNDVLEVVPNGGNEFKLFQSGFSVAGDVSQNLIFKAWYFLREAHSLPGVDCHLHKVIPMGAGLGGGSADGTFMIELLDKKFSLSMKDEEKRALAEMLGSDCPFFLVNSPSMVTGRGEFIRPIELNLRGKYMLLVKLNIHVSTAEAFSNIRVGSSGMDWQTWSNSDLSTWKQMLRNDFEQGIFGLHPLLAEVKQEHYAQNALYAQMTGTGSCVFGIYDHEPKKMPLGPEVWQAVVTL